MLFVFTFERGAQYCLRKMQLLCGLQEENELLCMLKRVIDETDFDKMLLEVISGGGEERLLQGDVGGVGRKNNHRAAARILRHEKNRAKIL